MKGNQPMQKKEKQLTRIILTILAGIAGILLFGLILMEIQSRIISRYVEDEVKESSAAILEEYENNELVGGYVRKYEEYIHQGCLNLVDYMTGEDPDLAESEEYLRDMEAVISAEDVMMIDRSGNVLASAEGTFRDLKDEQYAPLYETFDTSQMTQVRDDSRIQTGEFLQVVQVDTVQNPVFYALAIDDNRACVIYESGIIQKLYSDIADAWNYTLSNKVIGSDGFAFSWSGETGKILYYPDQKLLDQDIDTLGIKKDRIRDGVFVREQINGEELYLYPVYLEEQDAWVACAVPAAELTQKNEPVNILLWLIFAILAADSAYYAVLLLKGKDFSRAAGSRKKHLIFIFFCSVILFLCSCYLQTLYLMSRWASGSMVQIAAIEKELEDAPVFTEGFQQYSVENQEKPVKMIAWYLGHYPDRVTAGALDEMAASAVINELRVLDEQGNVTAASSTYMPSANGMEDAGEKEETSGIKYTVTVPLKNGEDNITGSVSADCYSTFQIIFMEQKSLGGILQTVRPSEGGFVFSVDSESHCFTYYPEGSMVGKNVFDYGMKEDDLRDNLCKFITLNNENLYVTTGQSGNDLIYMAIERGRLFRECIPLSAAVALGAFLILLLTGLSLYTLPETGRKVQGEQGEKAVRIGHSREISAEHKVFRNLFFGAGIIAAGLLLTRYFSSGKERILDYVLNGNWEYGINVFALTASLVAAFEIGLVLFLIRKMADILSQIFSLRSVTILQMLTSLMTYVGIFLIMYRSLVYFGMDPTVLMTSAGIVSVVIGIGANSLVGDFIAGILLLIEGDVQIGDIVRIGGFRGRVEELGIRKTKVLDFDHLEVKIVPNREIREVVHLSMHRAIIFMEFQITYEEDLEKVEKLLREELAGMEERVPELMEAPVYRGVRRLDDNGVVLMVRVACHEINRDIVIRGVNRNVYMMFRRNGIEIPFPQLTIHDGSSQLSRDDS